ncbi:MAG: type II toxin-antitoxin system VapC family toxin [Planctomycetota bacterium]|nr:type II toxin-antitoxin system VapC family toxin [Planctomycetota bacterium]
MKLLLDTHTLLWFLADAPNLSTVARTTLEDSAHERWLSPISLLEIALKVRIRKLTLAAPFGTMFPAQLQANHVRLLPIEAHHAAAVAAMPLHHRDPFDHLIIAQAIAEGMTLVSADAAFDAYGANRLW